MNRMTYIFLLLIPLLALACGLTDQAVTTALEPSNAAVIAPPEPIAPPQDDGDVFPLDVWQEPQSGAFSVRAPAGWLVSGGVSQSTGFYHPWLEMAEPSGRAAVFYGSRDMHLFILPHPQFTQAGYPEGSAIQENGLSFVVNSFMTGEQAAEEILRYWIQPICTDLVIDDRRTTNTSVNEGSETSEGLVDFHCLAQGQPMAGKYLAATYKIVDPATGIGIWFIGNTTSYIALQNYEGQAEKAFLALRESLIFNPQSQAGLTPIPGAPGLYYAVSAQDNGQKFPFVEDQMDDFCIRHGC